MHGRHTIVMVSNCKVFITPHYPEAFEVKGRGELSDKFKQKACGQRDKCV